jgi:transposase InsO family protein
MSQIHSQARTTPRTRTEIKESTASLAELAERYNITKLTARKWKNRESPEDLSHRPHKLNTTLTPAQEAIAVELRCMALLPLDDLLAVVREFINPDVSRAGLDRCLRRHGVANLRELQAKALADAGDNKPAIKTFKDYEPGFVHMDIKYLPQMPDESHRRYLFVAIDRATRWVFMHIYADQSEDSSVDFLNRLERAAPMRIIKLLTDNGSQFTDRFTSKKRVPSGNHKFDVRCKALNIEHRLCPPRHPQTNGMVERFNARISEVVNQTRFASAAELEATLNQYVKTYNHLIPQRALKHISPVQALKDWRAKKPELFKKRVYNQPGLDNYPGIAIIKVQPSAHTASVLSIKGAGLTMGTRGATLGHLKEITFSAPDQLACRTFIVVETDEQARLIQALLQSPNDLQALYLIKEP